MPGHLPQFQPVQRSFAALRHIALVERLGALLHHHRRQPAHHHPLARAVLRVWGGFLTVLLVSVLAFLALCLLPLAAAAQGTAAPGGRSQTLMPVRLGSPAATADPAPSHPGAADAGVLASVPSGRGGEPELRAQLTPTRYTTLAAEIGARLLQLAVTDGARIQEGQLLLRFDCSLQQTQRERAQAAHDAAKKQLASQRRLAELGATGQIEADQAEAEVAKSRAELAQIDVLLGKCEIRAPFDGRVAEQKVRELQFVQPGQALLEVLDDSALELEFIMPSRWLARVKPGSAVKVAIDETGRSYTARVQRLGARVDPVSQSIKVVATIDGRPAELVAGMSGRVTVPRTP